MALRDFIEDIQLIVTNIKSSNHDPKQVLLSTVASGVQGNAPPGERESCSGSLPPNSGLAATPLKLYNQVFFLVSQPRTLKKLVESLVSKNVSGDIN